MIWKVTIATPDPVWCISQLMITLACDTCAFFLHVGPSKEVQGESFLSRIVGIILLLWEVRMRLSCAICKDLCDGPVARLRRGELKHITDFGMVLVRFSLGARTWAHPFLLPFFFIQTVPLWPVVLG